MYKNKILLIFLFTCFSSILISSNAISRPSDRSDIISNNSDSPQNKVEKDSYFSKVSTIKNTIFSKLTDAYSNTKKTIQTHPYKTAFGTSLVLVAIAYVIYLKFSSKANDTEDEYEYDDEYQENTDNI